MKKLNLHWSGNLRSKIEEWLNDILGESAKPYGYVYDGDGEKVKNGMLWTEGKTENFDKRKANGGKKLFHRAIIFL